MLRARMTAENIQSLEDMKRRLSSEKEGKRGCLAESQWNSLKEIAESIAEACDDGDLEEVARRTRQMKNKLRKRAFRRTLEALESGEPIGPKKLPKKSMDGEDEEPKKKQPPPPKVPAKDKKEKKPEGECTCAKCGQVIDGSRNPCVEGALCTKCGLKKTVDPEDDKGKKKSSKKPDKEPDSGSDRDEDSSKEESVLRRRQW